MDEELETKKTARTRRGTQAERDAVDALPIWPELVDPRSPYADGKLPRVKGSDTSEAAAEEIAEHAPNMRQRVYATIVARREYGATDDELEVEMRLRHQSLSARRRELVLQGYVVDSERARRTRSGRVAVVWVAKEFAR